jgi:hypothetical protein
MKRQISLLSKIITLLVISLISFLSSYVHASDGVRFAYKSDIFIMDWLVCGPFPSETDQGIKVDFLSEHGGESIIIPSPSLQHSSISVPSGKVSWRQVKAGESGKLDFTQHLQPNQKHVAYASTVIYCDA